MATERTTWEAELDELLSICECRSDRADQLPHCAICARYSGTELAFERVLSLLEKLPILDQPQALTFAAQRLAKVPASQRSQQVSRANFGQLLNSPGWPLVTKLIIDMAYEGTATFLSHPRLCRIEELTLLGFAYGNAVAGSKFTTALLDSSLTNVRSLTLHSTDLSEEDLVAFWSSPFVARLERIDGLTYRGEVLPHALQAKEIQLSGTWDAVESFDYLLKLIDPKTTPHLRKLSLGSYYADGSAPMILEFFANHRHEFERISELEISFYGQYEAMKRKFSKVAWPKSMRKISWSWHSPHGTILGFDGDTQSIYRADLESIAGYDSVTHYTGLALELANIGDISLSLQELKLIAFPTDTIENILAGIRRFENLNRLCILYPFSEAQFSTFITEVAHIDQVEIYLTMKTGCYTTQYREDHEEKHHTDASPRFLLNTALAARNLSIYSDVLDVSHTSSGLEHITVKTDNAMLELTALDPKKPVEVLTIAMILTAETAHALAQSTLLGRVYRLEIQEGFTDEAAAILTDCPQLRGVRILEISGYKKISEEGFATLICSPYLAGVLDLTVWSAPEDCEKELVKAPMLPGLVNLDLHGNRESEILPASGRFRSLRRMSEWFSMSVFRDGRLARKWLTAHTAIPLHAKLQHFVDWVYRIPEEPLPELIARLDGCDSEETVKEGLRDVIAKAFDGAPLPDGMEFANLTLDQQTSIRSIVKLDNYYWCVAGLLNPVFASYGLPHFEREHLERYMAGKDIWGHDVE